MGDTPLRTLFELAQRDMARERSRQKMEPVFLPPEMIEPPSKNVAICNKMLRDAKHNELRADYRHKVLEGQSAIERYMGEGGSVGTYTDSDGDQTRDYGSQDIAFDELERTLRIAQCLNCLPRNLRRLVEFKVSNPDTTCSDAAIWCDTSELVIRKWWMAVRRFVREFEQLHATENKSEQTPVSTPTS